MKPEYDIIDEVKKSPHEARTFEEVLKFNPYHGYHGYFSSANATGARASLQGKTEHGQKLLDQYKEKHGGGSSGSASAGNSKPAAPEHKMVEGRNLLKEMKPKDVGKMTTEEVLAAQGFDGKPKVANTMDDFYKAVEDSGMIAVRGIAADDDATVDAYVDQLMNGDFYVKCDGGNAMGRGMYCAASFNGTNDYGECLSTANAFSDFNNAQRFINMTLDKSAKVIELSDLQKMAKKDGKKLGTGDIGGPHIWSGPDTAGDDIGAYAAALGYDAIKHTNGTWSSNYLVVLNRTKLTIFSETGDIGEMDDGIDLLAGNRAPLF